MEKAKEYAFKARNFILNILNVCKTSPSFEKYFLPNKRLFIVIFGVSIFIFGALLFLGRDRTPSAVAQIKMVKSAQRNAERSKSLEVTELSKVSSESTKTTQVQQGLEGSEASQGAEAPSTLPADSPSFKGAQIDVTSTGYLPKISSQGVTNYQAYARPVAPKALAAPYKLSIVIGGFGLDSGMANSAITDLPKEVALAFYPFVPQSQDLNVQARSQGFETLVMLSLEPMAFPKDDPGPDVLLTGLDPQENKTRLYKHLSQMTGYIGTVAYQGSRFMRSESDFVPVLTEHKDRGLLFLDPSTSRRTLSHDLGKKIKAPVLKTIFMLSPDFSDQQIESFLKKIEESVKEDGTSILYVEAHSITLAALKKWLPTLDAQKISLVPVSSQTLNKKHGY